MWTYIGHKRNISPTDDKKNLIIAFLLVMFLYLCETTNFLLFLLLFVTFFSLKEELNLHEPLL